MFKDNPDYYPTPMKLIHKMLNKLDFRFISNVLEPSGGSGELIEGIIKKFDYTNNHRNSKKYDIDTIELYQNLRHVLIGKGYRVVHDDFLSYSTYKKYDAIIANFPFSAGDRHLIHAIRMQQQRGGSVVALINAETLRNPYSNTRKDLIRLLEEHNAEVEYIENAFSDADRSTGVEVALVYVKIEKQPYNSSIIETLKQEEKHKEKVYTSTQVIESDFIKGIVSQYEYEVKAGLRLIDEYNTMKPLMLASFERDTPILKLELDNKDDSSSLENGYIKQIRSKYWKALFNNDQFIGLFTSNLKEKYMSMINELKDYDFSFYNIYTIRLQLSKEMTQGLEDTILNLFEEFSNKYHYYNESSKNIHYYNGWATNKAYKINKKVIIPLNGYNTFWGKYEPTQWAVKDKLADIEKVMNYLDQGKTEELDLHQALKMAEHYGETKKIETKFYFVTFFKKGTAHLEFKNEDILGKFNIFGSQKRNWLPPSYGKVKYSDMTMEEKQVINDFEGEQSYNKVMKNKSYFILNTAELLRLTS
jgi:hypothetical protein